MITTCCNTVLTFNVRVDVLTIHPTDAHANRTVFKFSEMEVLPEGKNFRLVHEEELPEILELLGKYLPDSLKVRLRSSSQQIYT